MEKVDSESSGKEDSSTISGKRKPGLQTVSVPSNQQIQMNILKLWQECRKAYPYTFKVLLQLIAVSREVNVGFGS